MDCEATTGFDPIADIALKRQFFEMFDTLGKSVAALLLACASESAGELPTEIARQVPPDYAVLGSASSSVGGGHRFYFVALGSRHELKSYLTAQDRAPVRPLLVFERRLNGRYVLAGRNDDVVLRADDAGLVGNGCDPFENHHIEARGPYVTVENGVSCGAHWTDYVTFRFDPRLGGYAFDSWRFQSWKFNPSKDPNAEALVPDVRRVVRSPRGRTVPFANWRRSR